MQLPWQHQIDQMSYQIVLRYIFGKSHQVCWLKKSARERVKASFWRDRYRVGDSKKPQIWSKVVSLLRMKQLCRIFLGFGDFGKGQRQQGFDTSLSVYLSLLQFGNNLYFFAGFCEFIKRQKHESNQLSFSLYSYLSVAKCLFVIHVCFKDVLIMQVFYRFLQFW